MRNAPVALFCAKNKIALKNAQIISKLFCMPTHKSPLAMTAVGIHTALIYAGLKGFDNSSLIAHMVLPLEFWESRAAMTKNNFIWDAPQSLGIAVSAVAASDNWDDMMQFLVAISGDVDTYAAIAGPLASLKFGEPSSNWLTVLEQAILMDNSSRAQRLACNYFEMKALYNANISIS